MNKAGLLEIPERGKVKITQRGIDAFKNGPDKISVAWLKQFPEFQEFHTPRPEDGSSNIKPDTVTTQDDSTVVGQIKLQEAAQEFLNPPVVEQPSQQENTQAEHERFYQEHKRQLEAGQREYLKHKREQVRRLAKD